MINETLKTPEKKACFKSWLWGKKIIRKGGGAKKVLELIHSILPHSFIPLYIWCNSFINIFKILVI